MASKAQRQHKISQFLEESQVHSQSQLTDLLKKSGMSVNQATVSRDLEELGAIKVRVPGGETVYAIPELPRSQVSPVNHLKRVLSDWVVEVSRSGDLVVVSTPPGSAHVVASAIDRNGVDSVLGTVAGDDALLVIATEGAGANLVEKLTELAGLVGDPQ